MQSIKSVMFATALLVVSSALAAQEWADPDVYVAVMYESAYVSEGRDNLGDGGLASFEIGADFGSGFSGGIWTADDTSEFVNYEETNYFIEYGFELASLDAYIGYTHLNFSDGSSDNELGFGLASTTLPVTLGFDYVRSAEADGAFIELSVSKDYETNSGISLTPYLIYALDYGYASEAHDGNNHTQIGVDVAKEVANNIEVFVYLATSMAGRDVENDGAGDQTWGGLGINYNF